MGNSCPEVAQGLKNTLFNGCLRYRAHGVSAMRRRTDEEDVVDNDIQLARHCVILQRPASLAMVLHRCPLRVTSARRAITATLSG